ncbi:tail fiber assembly protein [Serratia sp. UGAL515B_01]|uniref:tail fiber assembly protein n=1 Tax=Serratia sp. UGAL515B_01 TaxID=2986763 RepID=UPI0029544888|nr:tail fiber assembly protein [Serratia sp. UGAL515B_01]WON76299.1 tail fiber assembly protein [Serratia sp. UGAL515B_01]
MNMAILDKNNIATTSGVLTVFNYDGKTGEYLDSCEEYLSEGVGLPANSCIEAPPKTSTGYIARRVGDVWDVVEDHRGKTLYSTETGQSVTISELGALPVNSTELVPNTPYDKWDGKEWVTDEIAQHDADIATATQQRAELLVLANAAITPLTDAVDLGMAAEEETVLLNNWRRYRVQLNRIEMDAAPNINWPEMPTQKNK